jgi:diadenosine tetraphosphate (Ap4A) HIT family hydrolase
LSQLEQAAIWVLIPVVRQATEADHSPDGYIGVNIGVMAGQTVSHAHLHLMPDTAVTFRILAAQNRVRVGRSKSEFTLPVGDTLFAQDAGAEDFAANFGVVRSAHSASLPGIS